MIPKFEIKCINKSDRFNPHERIINVGGFDNGERWKISQQDAISFIESHKYEFFVRKDGHTVNVIVAVSAWGNKYIKTEPDGLHPDNLLSLPECP